jgi:hypothetical protein
MRRLFRVGYQKIRDLKRSQSGGELRKSAGGKRDKSQLVPIHCRPPVDGGTECRKHHALDTKVASYVGPFGDLKPATL